MSWGEKDNNEVNYHETSLYSPGKMSKLNISLSDHQRSMTTPKSQHVGTPIAFGRVKPLTINNTYDHELVPSKIVRKNLKFFSNINEKFIFCMDLFMKKFNLFFKIIYFLMGYIQIDPIQLFFY